MYKGLIADKVDSLKLKDFKERELQEDEVKVRVKFGSPKHGTEMTMLKGISPFQKEYYDNDWDMFLKKDEKEEVFPMDLGNMWVGSIVEKGKAVNNLKIGQRVAGYGGLKEYQYVNKEDVLVLPENMNWKSALCYDPARFALGGIRDSSLKLGDRVAVFGLGAIGLLTVQMAFKAGAVWVAAVDPIKKRRKVAAKLGADLVLDPVQADVGYEIKQNTDKKGVDLSIDTSGHTPVLQTAIRSTAYGGKVTIVGWYKELKGHLNLGREAHFNIPKIIFSRACSEPNRDHPRWDLERINKTCWQMLSRGYYDCGDIITPVVNFKDILESYRYYVDKNPAESIKLGVKFNQ